MFLVASCSALFDPHNRMKQNWNMLSSATTSLQSREPRRRVASFGCVDCRSLAFGFFRSGISLLWRSIAWAKLPAHLKSSSKCLRDLSFSDVGSAFLTSCFNFSSRQSRPRSCENFANPKFVVTQNLYWCNSRMENTGNSAVICSKSLEWRVAESRRLRTSSYFTQQTLRFCRLKLSWDWRQHPLP